MGGVGAASSWSFAVSLRVLFSLSLGTKNLCRASEIAIYMDVYMIQMGEGSATAAMSIGVSMLGLLGWEVSGGHERLSGLWGYRVYGFEQSWWVMQGLLSSGRPSML